MKTTPQNMNSERSAVMRPSVDALRLNADDRPGASRRLTLGRFIGSLIVFLCLVVFFSSTALSSAQPLRVFIRGGVKTHGPNEHDHPRFLNEWKQLLAERGMEANGSMEFPTSAQLEKTDVMVIYAADGMKITGEERQRFERFLRRGGGVVVVHDGVVSGEENEWCKEVIGGAWIWKDQRTKWLEGDVGIYFINQEHPITQGISNYDWKDEIYYDLDMAGDVNVLATSFHSVFVIAPQLWTYEKTWENGSRPYRAFVSLPGHYYDVFNSPHYRAILMRGIAWAGKRSNADEFCTQAELDSLKYPEGGPLHPDKAVEKLNVHPEFDIQLVASEPQIQNVISMDWSPDGRLWVAETPEYPNGRRINRNDDPIYPERAMNPSQYEGEKVDRPAKDRISWLEDKDGDGIMDVRHIFADYQHGVPGGLELITSMVLYNDGVIVAQAPDILWLRDTDSDGVCDKVETLYTGFGNFDTHAVLNNFRWGLDGWVYGSIGYSAGEPRSGKTGKEFGRVTAGVIRFKPDGSALEQVSSGSCNTWGFDFAPNGELFFTTATCGQHFLHVVVPEKFLEKGNAGNVRAFNVVPDHQNIQAAIEHSRPAYVQIDWVGAFTAAAGCCLYNGGAWPERFDGSHFVSETTMSLVHHEMLEPRGVTYTASREEARKETEFVTGTDLWFRPIHQRVGPDGALYVVDLYNQAAIHNDTRGPKHGAGNAATRPDRDHKFARIYRIQHKQAKQLEIPNFSEGNGGTLSRALRHANGWVRDTAARLLRESNAGGQAGRLERIVQDATASGPQRNAAMQTLEATGQLTDELLGTAFHDSDPVVRVNALRIAQNRDNSGYTPELSLVQTLIRDPEPRVRLNMLLALSTCEISREIAMELIDAWPSFGDEWTQSAALAVVHRNPMMFMTELVRVDNPSEYRDLAEHTTRLLANQRGAEGARELVLLLSRASEKANPLKSSALKSLADSLRANEKPAWNVALRSALSSLLNASDPAVVEASLPLVARWDANDELSEELKPTISKLNAKLADNDLPDAERAHAAEILLGVRRYDASIVPVVGNLLGANSSDALREEVIEALGGVPDDSAGEQLVEHFKDLSTPLQNDAFGEIIRRASWTGMLLDAVEKRQIALTLLGPANLHRLKTHSNNELADRALSIIAAIRGPEEKEKDQLIAQFADAVEQPGDLENGKQLFVMNCGTCHKFDGEGSDLAPDLTGMGAHGPHDLLVHILDPNRVVEPNFVSTSVETKDDEVFDGIVERENAATLVLRNATGTFEIPKGNILERRSTGISLMPGGFEALGEEGLRDLIQYICADESKYRIVNLQPAFTANSQGGLYRSREARRETLRFTQFGLTRVNGIPFEIVSPTKSRTGNNVVVLKGGDGYSDTLPQKVEAEAGFKAKRIHILGGVGGWAWPYGGEELQGKPVAKLTLRFKDGQTEEKVFKNGVEFADYNGRAEVPGSEEAPGVVRYGQVRWFTVEVEHDAEIESIVLESFDNQVAPTFVAMTAEME